MKEVMKEVAMPAPYEGMSSFSLASNGRVLPQVPTRISYKRKKGALLLERLIILGGERPGGPKDWIINDVEINGTSQLSTKDLPGALFGSRGVAAGGKHARSTFLFSGLDVIEPNMEVAVTVTYVGPNPEGMPFGGGIHGKPAPQRPTVLPIATKFAVKPTAKITISALLDTVLRLEALEISDEGTAGGAADWMVNDLRVNQVTRFGMSGDIPGDLFSTESIDSFVQFGPGKLIEIDVTYIGLETDGAPFIAKFFGTVMRDFTPATVRLVGGEEFDMVLSDRDIQNYTPPPDVHAIVTVSGQDGSEEVIGHCDWRAPYFDADLERT